VTEEIDQALDRGDTDRATELAIRTYGPELVGWLAAILPSDEDAYDAFSWLSEELWRSLARFDRRCSLRTWCYMLARQAAARIHAQPRRAHEELVSSVPSSIAAQVISTTRLDAQRRESRYAEIRRQLPEEDQALLVLRVDRDLSWRDIALVLGGEGTPDDELERRAAALRKQFQRIKDELRALAGRTG
jgi:RNA polymerase sigma-70 factor, ECF subfamily